MKKILDTPLYFMAFLVALPWLVKRYWKAGEDLLN